MSPMCLHQCRSNDIRILHLTKFAYIQIYLGGVDLMRLDSTKLHLKVSRSACLEVNQVRRALRSTQVRARLPPSPLRNSL